MLKIRETVIVEGKYDKIKLGSIVDANVISTNGFRVFSDETLANAIKTAALKTGIVILTDSDRAGFVIRNYVKNIARDGVVKHAYIPAVSGKERRKDTPSKEGFLGVEGVSAEMIIDALNKADCEEKTDTGERVEKSDLFLLGLSGGAESAVLRRGLCQYLSLPPRLSANALLDVINAIYTKDEFVEKVKEFKEKTDI